MLRVLSALLVAVAKGQSEGAIDLVCNAGQTAQTWRSTKKRFRGLFEGTAVFRGIKQEILTSTLDTTMAELKAARALEPEYMRECGIGKLNLQMLSVNTIDDAATSAQLLTVVEKLSSPILTLILDVPWLALAESGWPVFGFLAQLNLRRRQSEGVNTEEADGLTSEPARAFIIELTEALGKGDIQELRQLSAIFLSLDLSRDNTLGTLTAIAAQAALETSPQSRIQLLEALQRGFKQAIASAPELDLALGTQWPLWGLVHMAVDGLAAPMSAD